MYYVTVRKDSNTSLYAMNLIAAESGDPGSADLRAAFDPEGPEEAGVFSGFFRTVDDARAACRRDVDSSASFEEPNFLD